MLSVDGLAASHALALRTIQQELDKREERVAVLNRHGRILVVNDAWVRHVRGRGGSPAAIGVGENYLQWIRCLCATADAARRIAEPVEDLLDAVTDHVDVACRGPDAAAGTCRVTGTLVEAFGFHWFLVAHHDAPMQGHSRVGSVRPRRSPA